MEQLAAELEESKVRCAKEKADLEMPWMRAVLRAAITMAKEGRLSACSWLSPAGAGCTCVCILTQGNADEVCVFRLSDGFGKAAVMRFARFLQ